MKKLFTFILICLVCACHQPEKPLPAVKDPNYQKAKSFLAKQPDSAFYYFNQVATAAKDSLQTSYAFNYMAYIQSEAGDHFGSQESLAMSLKYLDTAKAENQNALASTYNELGLSSLSLRNYDAARAFFEQAIRFSKPDKYRLVFLNNKALAYQRNGDYLQALQIYRQTLAQAKEPGTYARILTNMATAQWLSQTTYRAAPALLVALQLRKKEEDLWGQNSSYAHLADYYAAVKPDSALYYATRMYAIAREIRSPDDQLEALEKLIRVGPVKEVKPYFKRYQQLNDSLQTARNAAKNQFALIRYEVEKHKADNLKLQQDNNEKRYQLIKQRFLTFGVICLMIIGSITAYFWYRKRKLRMESESREALRISQLKTSKKVHDVVANGLYRIMTELDHQTELDKTRLADKIEDLYEKSRDISYEKEVPAIGVFHERVADLVTSFADETVKVALVGNDPQLWNGLSATREFEVEHILQELLVNMKKHSQASRVALRFERLEDQLHIHYTDNGVGIPGPLIFKNGLINTGNRIDNLQGKITFETNVQQGIKIHLNFPVA